MLKSPSRDILVHHLFLCVGAFPRVYSVCVQLITEQASFNLPRGAEIEGKCDSTESEIHISWKNNAYTLRIYFSKVCGGKHLYYYHLKNKTVLV